MITCMLRSKSRVSRLFDSSTVAQMPRVPRLRRTGIKVDSLLCLCLFRAFPTKSSFLFILSYLVFHAEGWKVQPRPSYSTSRSKFPHDDHGLGNVRRNPLSKATVTGRRSGSDVIQDRGKPRIQTSVRRTRSQCKNLKRLPMLPAEDL